MTLLSLARLDGRPAPSHHHGTKQLAAMARHPLHSWVAVTLFRRVEGRHRRHLDLAVIGLALSPLFPLSEREEAHTEVH